jgi:hypothetical protein
MIAQTIASWFETRALPRFFPHRHAPRMRGIRYAAALRFITDVSEYWIIRIRG